METKYYAKLNTIISPLQGLNLSPTKNNIGIILDLWNCRRLTLNMVLSKIKSCICKYK